VQRNTFGPFAPSAVQGTDWRSGYLPLIIGGIGAMASALLMPWLTVATPFAGQFSRSGLSSQDGKFLALGVVYLAVVAALESRDPGATTRSLLLFGVIGLAVAVFVEYQHMTTLMGAVGGDLVRARTGFGVYAMGIGLVCTFTGTLKRRLLLR
jgi:hypothetical protein